MGLLEIVVLANAGGLGLLGGLFIGIIVGFQLIKSLNKQK